MADDGARIAKVIARAGICSRREAEKLIDEGRVSLNGDVLSSPVTKVNDQDQIEVDGKALPVKEAPRLFMFHKPAGCITSNKDEKGRKTVFDLLPKNLPRLVTVGRLDFNTEGLLLLTNDGGLSRYLELPQTGLERCYRVRAHGRVDQRKLEALKKGPKIEGIKYGPVHVEVDKAQGANSWLYVRIHEGKNREVRRVLSSVDLEVNRLIRLAYGPFELLDLPKGNILEIKKRDLQAALPEYFKV